MEVFCCYVQFGVFCEVKKWLNGHIETWLCCNAQDFGKTMGKLSVRLAHMPKPVV